MKKFFVYLSCMMLVLLSGCKKDEDASLAGTVWEKNDGSVQTFLSFTSIQAAVSIQGGSTFYYSYEYNDPIVLMYPEDADKASLKGIISGEQMSVVNLSNERTIGIFIKR